MNPAAVDVLHDHLLVSIFLLLESPRSKASCRLTCKRFRSCLDQATTHLKLFKQGRGLGALHVEFTAGMTEQLAKSCSQAQATLLQQHLQRLLQSMPHVSSLSWHEMGCFWGENPLSALLHPSAPQLRTLDLHRVGAFCGDHAGWSRLLSVLGQLSSLRELGLHVMEARGIHFVSRWRGLLEMQHMPLNLLISELGRLSSLTRLCIKQAHMPGGSPEAIDQQQPWNPLQVFAPLTGLQSLELELRRGCAIPSAQPLSSLTRLTCLSLKEGKGLVSLAGLQHLTGLRSLTATVPRPVSLQPLSCLSHLTHLGLEQDLEMWLGESEEEEEEEVEDLAQLPREVMQVTDLRDLSGLATLQLPGLLIQPQDLADLLHAKTPLPGPCAGAVAAMAAAPARGRALQVLNVAFEGHLSLQSSLWDGLACCSQLRQLRLDCSIAVPMHSLPLSVPPPSTTKLMLMGFCDLGVRGDDGGGAAAAPSAAGSSDGSAGMQGSSSLAVTRATPACPDLQSCSPQVHHLTLQDCIFSLREVVRRFPRLRRLMLLGCDFTVISYGLAPLAALDHLEILHMILGDQLIEDEDNPMPTTPRPLCLGLLQQCAQLQGLHLRFNTLEAWTFYMGTGAELAKLSGCGHMESLELFGDVGDCSAVLSELSARRPELSILSPVYMRRGILEKELPDTSVDWC